MFVRTLKRGVKRMLASGPGWRLVAPRLRRPGIVVLMYHRINAEPEREARFVGIWAKHFEQQMHWLAERCEPIDPDDIERHMTGRRTSRPAVVVTFDDGYRDYHDLAYPVLARLGIPAVVFLATSLIDEGRILWTDEVDWAARRSRRTDFRLPWSDETVRLDGDASRADLSARIRRHLKEVPDTERREVLAKLLPELEAPELEGRQMLSWDEVRRTMDLTRYGGHTHTHPILSRLTRDAAEREIGTCRERITKETGKAPTLFAYPNGKPADYTKETQDILRENGFRVAFATTEGIAGPGTNWMEVARVAAADGDAPDFAWVMR